MKILYLIPDTDLSDQEGLSVHSIATIESFATFSEVTVICQKKGKTTVANTTIYEIPKGLSLPGLSIISRKFSIDKLLKRLFRKTAYDIIYERHHIFGFGIVNGFKFQPNAIRVSEVNDIAFVISKSKIVRTIISIFEKRTLRLCHKIVSPGEIAKELLIKQYHIPRNKIEIVSNGTNTNIMKPMKIAPEDVLDFSIPNGKKILGFVGLFYPWQGVDLLIDMMKLLPNDYILLIVGGNGYKQDLENKYKNKVTQLNLNERVFFTGKVNHNKIPNLINLMDLTYAPLVNERMKTGSAALKLFEYAACGVPYLTTEAARITNEKIKGGVIVGGMNPTSLDFAEATKNIFADQELYQKLRVNGPKIIQAEYSWTKLYKDFVFQTLELKPLY